MTKPGTCNVREYIHLKLYDDKKMRRINSSQSNFPHHEDAVELSVSEKERTLGRRK